MLKIFLLTACESKHKYEVEAQYSTLSYPLLGNAAMALGSSKLLLTRTLRLVPSRRATSMVLRPVSVQYIFLATQSTDSPSVVFRPWLITVSMPLPSKFERLKNKVKSGHYISLGYLRLANKIILGILLNTDLMS